MTVDEALARALVVREAADTQTEVALVTLAAEVQRYRKAVEEVKFLRQPGCGPLLAEYEVLAILEGK